MGARALAKEASAREEIGIRAEYLNTSNLMKRFNIQRPAAILSHDSASANPAQLTAGLLEAALTRKAQIVSPVEITDMAETATRFALATRKGRSPDGGTCRVLHRIRVFATDENPIALVNFHMGAGISAANKIARLDESYYRLEGL